MLEMEGFVWEERVVCFRVGVYTRYLSMMFFSYINLVCLIAEAVYFMVHQGRERHWLLVHLLMNVAKVTGESPFL